MDFRKIKTAVAKQFAQMQNKQLFRTSADKDGMWDTYLRAFPEGSNPMYRKRTEHDCSCCRQFVKAVGNVVAVDGDDLVSLWDVQVDDPAYQAVADAMAVYVKGFPVENVFLHTERTAGTDKNFEQTVDNVKTWEHFFINIPAGYVAKGKDVGERLSKARADHDVLLRSLTELTADSVDTVLELIAQNSLYRGQEHKAVLEQFRVLKMAFGKLGCPAGDYFAWEKSVSAAGPVSRIRNTAIGTMLVDLSNDVDLEKAVKSFEAVVAPANYKRPTALVTKAMVEAAKAKIADLGLTSALERRFATIDDISVNNLLFVDRTAPKGGDVFDEIAAAAPVKTMGKVEEIGIEKFLADVLPKAATVEIMVDNGHTGNFVSLIAPTDPTAGHLFKWDNPFSWSYNGEMADSIKERVKKAGGDVSGDLCCRLAWWNHDDLDLHMIEPGGYEIFFPNKGHRSPCGGMLDVDMNAFSLTRQPVENIFYRNKKTMKTGKYKLFVENYHKRETSDVGFEVEIDFMGAVTRFVYNKPVKGSERVVVAEFKYDGNDVEFVSALPSTKAVRQLWGVNTMTFTKVKTVMLSPNYWNGHGVGNKHYFFMLDGCANDGKARGFFNEFLKEDLNAHRKVFEIVGGKMPVQEVNGQLSGVGFSSTQRASIMCRVTGSFTRTLKINF